LDEVLVGRRPDGLGRTVEAGVDVHGGEPDLAAVHPAAVSLRNMIDPDQVAQGRGDAGIGDDHFRFHLLTLVRDHGLNGSFFHDDPPGAAPEPDLPAAFGKGLQEGVGQGLVAAPDVHGMLLQEGVPAGGHHVERDLGGRQAQIGPEGGDGALEVFVPEEVIPHLAVGFHSPAQEGGKALRGQVCGPLLRRHEDAREIAGELFHQGEKVPDPVGFPGEPVRQDGDRLLPVGRDGHVDPVVHDPVELFQGNEFNPGGDAQEIQVLEEPAPLPG
jgi:hypothetical protein